MLPVAASVFASAEGRFGGIGPHEADWAAVQIDGCMRGRRAMRSWLRQFWCSGWQRRSPSMSWIRCSGADVQTSRRRLEQGSIRLDKGRNLTRASQVRYVAALMLRVAHKAGAL